MGRLVLFMILLLTVAACSQSTQMDQPDGQQMQQPEQDEQPQVPQEPQDPPTGEPADEEAPQEDVKEFTMEAKQFEFVPSTITVNEGDTVRLLITSTDVEHGIAIPEFGVNQDLPVGEEVVVEFVADQTGEFNMFCSVYCGQGHSSMTAQLIVQ